MADDAGDKTETPTPRRRTEARQRGQIARSQELNAAVLLLGGLIALALFGRHIWESLLFVMRSTLEANEYPSIDAALVVGGQSLVQMAKVIGPLFATFMLLAFGVLYAQVGFLITWEPLTPNLNKLNPINGLKRLFSPHSLVQLAQNVLKLTLIMLLVWLTVRGMINKMLLALTLDFAVVLPFGAELVFDLGLRLALLLFLLAIIDYVYQRYRHEKQLKMTKEEVKEEMKRMEGDPVVKRRRREVQLRLAAQRIQSAVPDADVVVTNPTHYAIAIRYQAETMAAPKVIAKGRDYLAQRIREAAAAAGVPIVEKPALARMLYTEVEVGYEIPEKFYRVIAEVLAYVYELNGRRIGPAPPVGQAFQPVDRLESRSHT